jgi:hypothetical protein
MAGWLIGNSVTTSTAVVSSFKVFFCFVTTRCLSAVVVLQPPCTYTATFWLVWSPSWTISSFQKRTRSGGGGRIKLKGVADQSLPRFHVPTVVVRDTGKMLYTMCALLTRPTMSESEGLAPNLGRWGTSVNKGGTKVIDQVGYLGNMARAKQQNL